MEAARARPSWGQGQKGGGSPEKEPSRQGHMGGAHPSDGLGQGFLGPPCSQPLANFTELASISSPAGAVPSARGSPQCPPSLPGGLSVHRHLGPAGCRGELGALRALYSQAGETHGSSTGRGWELRRSPTCSSGTLGGLRLMSAWSFRCPGPGEGQ